MTNARQGSLGLLPATMIAILALACSQKPSDQPRLVVGGPGDERSPVWMPDGKRIVCSSALPGFPADLYLVDVDSGTSTRLTTDDSGDNSPAVSPDGRSIAFHSDRAQGNADVYRLDVATSKVVRLTTNPARDGFPSWSPDGKRIVFQADGGGDPDLWLMNRDGGEKAPLVFRPGDDAMPAWSPDGRAIAFTSTAAGNPDIWLISPDDRKPVRLTKSDEAEFKPVWSPDGKRIVYCRGPAPGAKGFSALWVMNADGSNQRSLFGHGQDARATQTANFDHFDPAWSPDGRRLVFESNRDGDFDIWVIKME